MHSIFRFFLVVFIFLSFNSFAKNNDFVESCMVDASNVTLKSGWSLWEPYQFQKPTLYGKKLTGLDVEIQRAISKILRINIELEEINWDKHLEEIQTGVRDIAPGATFTLQRAKFARFSKPYRLEENSLFVSNKSNKSLYFNNTEEMIALARALNFRIGLLSGVEYSNDKLNQFIVDHNNKDIIFRKPNDVENLKALVKGEIDGFITDKLVGGSMVINNKLGYLVKEIPLDIKTPISFMLSKRSTPTELLDKVNDAITEIKKNGEYNRISKEYLFPILLLQTINSLWFYFVTILGVIAFAFSGVIIGARENATILHTFIYALVPTVIPGILYENIVNESSNINNLTLYILLVFVITFFGFSLIRILSAFNKEDETDSFIQKILENSSVYLDAIGMSSFIIAGVIFALTTKLDPLIIWGPLYAFCVSCIGLIIRDVLTKNKKITIFNGELNPEITIIWSLIFSFYLDFSSSNPSQFITTIVVFIVVFGSFLSRLAAIYFKLKNITYK